MDVPPPHDPKAWQPESPGWHSSAGLPRQVLTPEAIREIPWPRRPRWIGRAAVVLVSWIGRRLNPNRWNAPSR